MEQNYVAMQARKDLTFYLSQKEYANIEDPTAQDMLIKQLEVD